METVTVDAQALRSVLAALTGPGHLIRELQVLRGIGDIDGDNPIDLLIDQYNKAVESHNAASA